MTEILAWVLLGLLAANTVLLVVLLIRSSQKQPSRMESTVREELRLGREETATGARNLREEIANAQGSATELLTKTLGEIGTHQTDQLERVTKELRQLTESNESKIDQLRHSVGDQLREIREANDKKLEEMRKTVDEKLHETLEKRLGESFKLVSDRLEAVQRGLGEMQELASGVGDLKRVLTNVKARGTWGEIQLEAILDQILTSEQYDKNVRTREDSAEAVEFAVRLPGPDDDPTSCVWLPIDSKFPQEDYHRLLDAIDRGDADGVQAAGAALGRVIRKSAQEIHDKYLNPPKTTDFGILFVPTEGLYAELLRRPGLVEDLQSVHRIVVTGPTTISALLSSLRMGFRTLAIEKRASEVWDVLGAVKTEFGKFGGILEKVKKNLQTATRTIEETGRRTRVMERKLRDVEQLPSVEATQILSYASEGDEVETDREESEAASETTDS